MVFDSLVVLLGGCMLPMEILGTVSVIGAGVRAYRRTRGRWPHAGRTWAVFLLAMLSMLTGLLLITVMLILINYGNPAVLSMTDPRFDGFLWIGAALAGVGVVAIVTWHAKVYRVAVRDYGDEVFMRRP